MKLCGEPGCTNWAQWEVRRVTPFTKKETTMIDGKKKPMTPRGPKIEPIGVLCGFCQRKRAQEFEKQGLETVFVGAVADGA